MATKKYTSKTCLSINVVLGTGKNLHISFTPMTGGGSVYYCDNEDVQKALERHHMYDKGFSLVSPDGRSPDGETARVPLLTGEEQETAPEKQVVIVKSLNEAKDYLCEKFGMSRTKLKGVDGVKKAAADNGVEFEGI